MSDREKVVGGQGANEQIFIRLILEAIYLKYGYDFRHYKRAHIKRRILRRLAMMQDASLTDMLARVLEDRGFFQTLLNDLSITVTEMFRNPGLYRAMRTTVVPALETYPSLRIWHAGCSTGAEVYSTAIVLKEEALLERSQIYATDFNEEALQQARDGIFSLSEMRDYTSKYFKAGGREQFADYYTTSSDRAVMAKSLTKNIVFSEHNLVTDGVFAEMNMVVCCNVLIYFDEKLQERVLGLFHRTLCRHGYLCLGARESLRFTKYNSCFESVHDKENIYRKKS